MNIRILDLVIILAVAYLLWDKFKAGSSTNKAVIPLNGASVQSRLKN